jgi:hypothetical protein
MGFLLQFIWLGYGTGPIMAQLTLVLTGYYIHGIPPPAFLQFIWLGYGTGLMMAQ